MRTAYITHPDCKLHDTSDGHPECASRLYAIEDRFIATGLRDALHYIDAPEATEQQLLRVHTREHLDALSSVIPESGYARMFHLHVAGADTGADFDFLKGGRGKAVPRDSH